MGKEIIMATKPKPPTPITDYEKLKQTVAERTADNVSQEMMSTLIGDIDISMLRGKKAFKTAATIFQATPPLLRHTAAGILGSVIAEEVRIPTVLRFALSNAIYSFPQGFAELLEKADASGDRIAEELERATDNELKKLDAEIAWVDNMGVTPVVHLEVEGGPHPMPRHGPKGAITVPHGPAAKVLDNNEHTTKCASCFAAYHAGRKVFVVEREPPKEKPKPSRLARLNEITDTAKREFLLTLFMEAYGELHADWFHGLEGWSLPIAQAIAAAIDADPKALAENMRSGDALPNLRSMLVDRRAAEQVFQRAIERGETPATLPEFNLLHIAQPELAAVLFVNEGKGGKIAEGSRQLRNALDPIWSFAPGHARMGGVGGVLKHAAEVAGRVTNAALSYTYGLGSFLIFAFVFLGFMGVLFGGALSTLGISGGGWVSGSLLQLLVTVIFLIVLGASGVYVLFGGWIRLQSPRVTRIVDGREEAVWQWPVAFGDQSLTTAITKLVIALSVILLWAPIFSVLFGVSVLAAGYFGYLTGFSTIMSICCFCVWDLSWRLLDDVYWKRFQPTEIIRLIRSMGGDKIEVVDTIMPRTYRFRRIVFTAGMIFFLSFAIIVMAGMGGLEMGYVRTALGPALFIIAASYIYSRILIGDSAEMPPDLYENGENMVGRHRRINLQRAYVLGIQGMLSTVIAVIFFAVFDPMGFDAAEKGTAVASIRETRDWVWNGTAGARASLASAGSTYVGVELSSLERSADAADHEESLRRKAGAMIKAHGTEYCDGAAIETELCQAADRAGYLPKHQSWFSWSGSYILTGLRIFGSMALVAGLLLGVLLMVMVPIALAQRAWRWGKGKTSSVDVVVPAVAVVKAH